MNLQDAIIAFEKLRKGSFSESDRARIFATVEELGLTVFNLYEVPSKKYPQYIRDVDDILHVHQTMMVASRSSSGSIDRGLHPYPSHPYHSALSGWIHDKGQSGRPVCPSCHLEIPLVGQCEDCGWSPSESD